MNAIANSSQKIYQPHIAPLTEPPASLLSFSSVPTVNPMRRLTVVTHYCTVPFVATIKSIETVGGLNQ